MEPPFERQMWREIWAPLPNLPKSVTWVCHCQSLGPRLSNQLVSKHEVSMKRSSIPTCSVTHFWALHPFPGQEIPSHLTKLQLVSKPSTAQQLESGDVLQRKTPPKHCGSAIAGLGMGVCTYSGSTHSSLSQGHSHPQKI